MSMHLDAQRWFGKAKLAVRTPWIDRTGGNRAIFISLTGLEPAA
jgi:hypothetical protein